MRENFDFVTMNTYAQDVREASEHASGIIADLMRQIRDRDRAIWLMARAAGGELKFYPRDYDPRGELIVERCDADMSMRVFAKSKPQS